MSINTTFLRLTSETDKENSLKAVLINKEHHLRFSADAKSFELIPGAPFSYWVSEKIRKMFNKNEKINNSINFSAWIGLQTNNDFQWNRLNWEVIRSDKNHWVPLSKGGAYSRYYYNFQIFTNWKNNGALQKKWKEEELRLKRITENNSKCWNETKYFRPGLTWPMSTTSELGLRVLPAGCIFGNKGPTAFLDDDNNDNLLALLAVTNSAAYRGLVSLQVAAAEAAARHYVVGILQQTPLPFLDEKSLLFFSANAKKIWLIKQQHDQVEETSHFFFLPAILSVDGENLTHRICNWGKLLQRDDTQIQNLQAEIDNRCWELYGLDKLEQQSLMESGGVGSSCEDTGEPDGDEGEGAGGVPNFSDTLAEGLASWLFGAAIGRWDVGLASGKHPAPSIPGPFDQLPAVSSGMLIGAKGLHPAQDASGRLIPEHDLLVDDEGHGLDVVQRTLAVLAQVAGSQAEAWHQELEALLGSDLRAWYRCSFFERHLKRYSASRRKAPIYWQIGTDTGSYSVWLYYPRLTKDSLYRVLNETVNPKVQQEEQRLTHLRQSQPRSRQLEAQEAFVEELRGFRDEVIFMAPLFDPNLEDGVLLNAAPLWRLMIHSGWRKDTKSAWEALAKGEHDWAHLALKLWPERVIPKCAKERHLALVHDLEADLKTQSVAALIAQHTRPAVQEALAQLQAAPAIVGCGRWAKHKKAPGRPPKGTS